MQITTLLGSGGMAAVWRATHVAFNRQVALKVIHPALAGDERASERLLREARACARLRHPNTIAVIDSGRTSGGVVWIAFELATGGDVENWLRRQGGKADEREVWGIVRQCLNGLAALEDAGLVHRDIKPGNIFLEPDGTAKLADFGLVMERGEEESTTVVGTPAYMPPEQIRCDVALDVRADLYALGATAFHLMCGRPLYEGRSNADVLVQVLNDPVPDARRIAKHVGEESAKALQRLLCKERSGRPSSVRDALALVEPLAGIRSKPSSVPPLDPVAMAALAKRILVAKDGTEAHLVLAPGANFPRILLEPLLKQAGVVAGVDDQAIGEAGIVRGHARRLLVAKGDKPGPGIPGRTVRGDQIPPLADSVLIRPAPDRLSAIALVRPGTSAVRADLDQALQRGEIRFGTDALAIAELCGPNPPPTGRAVIARGRAPVHGRPAGFSVTAGLIDAKAIASGKMPQQQPPHAIVALWREAKPGQDGMDVRGRALRAMPAPEVRPNDLVGDGVELCRDEKGRTALRAVIPGHVHVDAAGRVRMAGVKIIDGDLKPGEIIDGGDVVIVKGSVKAGSTVRCSADLVVMGDIEDAVVETGGDLTVRGAIASGSSPVRVSGMLEAEGAHKRPIVAGAVKIHGDLRSCEVTSASGVEARRIAGGVVVAGGTIRCEAAGDNQGAATELWAGRQITLESKAQLARLAAQRVEIERLRLRDRCVDLAKELGIVEGQDIRAKLASYTRAGEQERIARELHRLEHLQGQAVAAEARTRGELVSHLQSAEQMRQAANNHSAGVVVDTVAYPGVVLRIADGPADPLSEPKLRLRIGVA